MSKEALSELCMKLHLLGFTRTKDYADSPFAAVYILELNEASLKVYIPLDIHFDEWGCRASFWHKKYGLYLAPGKHVSTHTSNMNPILEFLEKYLKKYG